jgi:hypothetical protein
MDNKDEIEEYQESLEMLSISMDNAYRVLTKKTSIRKLMNTSKSGCWFPYADIFNPTNKDIDSVVDYYCDLEEYEICAELVKIKNKRIRNSKINRINNSKLGGLK